MENKGCKYFYNNFPISEYCEKNKLDIKVIRARIFRFKNKYPKKDIDEIVNMAINYRRALNEKYYYEDIPLSEYCSKHNLKLRTIRTRIARLIEKNPDKSIDEIIDMAINYKDISKYYYKEVLLTEYCEKNKLDINVIRARIFRFKNKYPKKTVDEIVEMSVNYKRESNEKYYYEDVLLSEYCLKHKLNFSTIKARIVSLIEKNPDKPIDEIIDMAINYKDPRKYYYQDVLLTEYCDKNKLDINVIRARIFRFKNKYPKKTVDEIVEMSVNYKRESNEKYYYDDIPLSEYCLKHKLNFPTIKARIVKLVKKAPDKTIDEIIDMSINYIDASKNYYKGVLLTEYCKKNDLNIETIKSRMFRLKKEYPDKSIEDIIELAINFEKKINYKYYYQGKPLIEYCEKNKLNYKTLCSRIRYLKSTNPDKDINEIIELAINFKIKKNYKYYYQGKPLIEYCKENKLDYEKVYVRLKYLISKNTGKNIEEIIEPTLNFNKKTEKIIELAIKPNKKTNKYNYQGKSLDIYCKENDLNVETIKSRISRLKKEYPKKDINDIIELAINFEKKINYKYYYQGRPLIEYCKINNLNYSVIGTRIRRLVSQNPQKSLDDIIELAINHNKKPQNKYYYQGKPLTEYCEQEGINYNNIIVRIKKIKEKNPDLKLDEIIEIAINTNNEKIKYNYGGMSLYNYCIENNINYYTIYSKIWRKTHKNLEVNINEMMDIYYEETNKKKIRSILQKYIYDNIQELIESCIFIGISYESVKELQEIGFTVKDSVNIVYFFGELDSSNQKVISKDFIDKIPEYIYNVKSLKNTKKEIDDNLLLLYKLYKCNLYDSRELIIKDFKSNIYKMIYSTFNLFQINKTNEKVVDLYNELNFRLLELIDRCVTLNKFELLKYVLKSLRYYCFNYCYKNYVNKHVSLDKEFLEKKTLYNVIDSSLDGVSLEEEMGTSIDGHFSENFNKIINELDKNSLYFIKLKYIYNYDNSYIAEIMKLTNNEVDNLEIELINYLKTKQEIVSLVYKK